MTNQRKKYHSMQCPECHSHNTQSVSVAQSQSIRTGYNGYQSVSEFGRGLAPPPPRSEFAFPLGVAFWVGVLAFFGLAELSAALSESWPMIASLYGKHPIIMSAIVGVFAGLMVSSSAIKFNSVHHKKLIVDWNQGVVCKRCGNRFRN